MKISTTHQRFADCLGDQTALEHPENFLGPNWINVLNFWIYLDTLSDEVLSLIIEKYWDLDGYDRDNAFKAAKDTIGFDYAEPAWDTAPTIASGYATLELIASHNLESLKFLPLFLKHKI